MRRSASLAAIARSVALLSDGFRDGFLGERRARATYSRRMVVVMLAGRRYIYASLLLQLLAWLSRSMCMCVAMD